MCYIDSFECQFDYVYGFIVVSLVFGWESWMYELRGKKKFKLGDILFRMFL